MGCKLINAKFKYHSNSIEIIFKLTPMFCVRVYVCCQMLAYGVYSHMHSAPRFQYYTRSILVILYHLCINRVITVELNNRVKEKKWQNAEFTFRASALTLHTYSPEFLSILFRMDMVQWHPYFACN